MSIIFGSALSLLWAGRGSRSHGRPEVTICLRRLFCASGCLIIGMAAAGAEDSLPSKVNPLAAISSDALTATRQRPLFLPTRRQPSPPAAAVVVSQELETPPPPPLNLTLLGIVAGPDGRHALIKPNALNKTRIVQIGDEIDGWKVADVEAKRLVLTQAERSNAFLLFEAHKSLPKLAKHEKAHSTD